MKIYLAQNKSCWFRNCRSAIFNGLDLNPSTESDNDKLFCQHLCEQFEGITGVSIAEPCMVISLLSNEQDNSTITVSLQDPSDILMNIKKILSDENLLVGVTLHFKFNSNNQQQFIIVSKDLPVKEKVFYDDNSVVSNRYITEGLMETRDCEAYISIYIFTSTSYPKFQVNQRTDVNKMILDEGICHDAVIVPQNGAQVNCHKCFLIGHSSVFACMFSSDMEERRTDTVEMPDMSEEGVRAFLQFLYCGIDTVPNEKSCVAWELLYAGHKYDIPSLESAMTNTLISKPIPWLDVDVAVKLFLFARGMPSGKNLKLKAATKMGIDSSALGGSPTYVSLPLPNKVELLEYALKAVNTYHGGHAIAEGEANTANVSTQPIPTTSLNTCRKRQRK